MKKGMIVALAVLGLTVPALAVPTGVLTVANPVLDPTGISAPASTTVTLTVADPGGTGINSVSVKVGVLDPVSGLPAPGIVASVVPVAWVDPPFLVAAPQLPVVNLGVDANGGLNQQAAAVAQFPANMGVGVAAPQVAFTFTLNAVAPGVVKLDLANAVGGGYQGIVNWQKLVANLGIVVDPVVTVVPEPATLALLGLGGLLAIRRRR